jgi:glutamine synthetase
MFKQFSEVNAFIAEQKIQMIDYKFSDLWGRWHHVTLPASAFTEEVLTEGVGFDGSSVGFKNVHSGDMVLVPDFSTAFVDPFWDHKTLSFICNTLEADTKACFSGDPREVLRHAEKRMIKSGVADGSLWGPEFEFYVFDHLSFTNEINVAAYQVDSSEASWRGNNRDLGYTIPLHGGYHAIPPNDQLYNLRSEITQGLLKAGVPVKYHHHEVGGPGQCEIETPLLPLRQAADAIMIVKYFTKMTAISCGQIATFLPKPLFGEAGNGMHFHQQLWLNGKNAFYDPDGPNKLSKTALSYIGGLLYHAPSLLALTNPSTNSYRRLVPGYEAPVNAFFSIGNRSAAIRIPKYATQPGEVRFEFRPPDATCNPYLALAAMLLAGIDGVEQNIDPIASGFGPFNEDIFTWSPEKRKEIKSLPTSLDEALSALEQDCDYLTRDGVFPDDLVDQWIRLKRAEDQTIRSRPHPYEFELYFDL